MCCYVGVLFNRGRRPPLGLSDLVSLHNPTSRISGVVFRYREGRSHVSVGFGGLGTKSLSEIPLLWESEICRHTELISLPTQLVFRKRLTRRRFAVIQRNPFHSLLVSLRCFPKWLCVVNFFLVFLTYSNHRPDDCIWFTLNEVGAWSGQMQGNFLLKLISDEIACRFYGWVWVIYKCSVMQAELQGLPGRMNK